MGAEYARGRVCQGPSLLGAEMSRNRWLECLTPNPHASLFSGSMLPRLHILMSVLTHSDQVFLGLLLLLAPGIVILVMEFMHEEERATWPYHLKSLVWRAAVTSCTPNIAQSVSADTYSSSLTPHVSVGYRTGNHYRLSEYNGRLTID